MFNTVFAMPFGILPAGLANSNENNLELTTCEREIEEKLKTVCSHCMFQYL
jgi:hypothetical protein